MALLLLPFLVLSISGMSIANTNFTVGDCIVASFTSVNFTVFVNGSFLDPKEASNASSIVISVPKNATVDSQQKFCGNSTQEMHFHWEDWNSVNGSFLPRRISILFSKQEADPKYGISRIYGTLNLTSWKESVNGTAVEDRYTYVKLDTGVMSILAVPLGYGYLCKDPGIVHVNTSLFTQTPGPHLGTTLNATLLRTQDLRFEAFRPSHLPPDVKQPYLDCAYRQNDIIPIIVACTLAFLIVVVLVVYVWGRRRARQGDYQSV